MDASYTGKVTSIRWGGIYYVLSATPLDFDRMGRHCEICLHTSRMPQVVCKDEFYILPTTLPP